jgi:aminomethyltransferase
MMLARTGYTGEDGFELYLPAEEAVATWRALLEAGAAAGLVPVGLGARDTLRLEAGMPLYGHELTEEINPFEAGLGFAVKLKRDDFVGREALAQIRAARKDGATAHRKLACILCDGRRIPRQGHTIRLEDEAIGIVTSGTYSPTFDRPICMGLVDAARGTVDAHVIVDVRGSPLAGWITKRPFYKRTTA